MKGGLKGYKVVSILLVPLLLVTVAVLCDTSSLYPDNYAWAGGNLSVTRSKSVTEDASLEAGRDDNYGGSTYLQVEIGSEFHSILRTSLGDITPTGSTVSSATLYLYYYGGSSGPKDPAGRTYYLDRLMETDWVEGISDGKAETGAVDWNHRVHDTLSWTTAGGTYTTDNETTSAVPAAYGWMNFNVTNLAQYAVTNGVNGEWVIRDPGTETVNIYAHFYSSEGTTVPYIGITFTAPWDSYEDTPPTIIRDTFNSSYQTVYMQGTGFAVGNYTVGYYDGAVASGGNLTAVDENISVNGTGILNSQYLLSTDPNAAAGTWHALVQPASGYTALPSDYNVAVGGPDTYGLLANDSFTVEQSAIPKFPTVLAGIVVAGSCFGIYYWMRKRRGG